MTTCAIFDDPRVLAEIDAFQERESFRLGYQIGVCQAASEWYRRCSKDWVKSQSGYKYWRIDLMKEADSDCCN